MTMQLRLLLLLIFITGSISSPLPDGIVSLFNSAAAQHGDLDDRAVDSGSDGPDVATGLASGTQLSKLGDSELMVSYRCNSDRVRTVGC